MTVLVKGLRRPSAVLAPVQRDYGPRTAGTPATWSADVEKALKGTAADRAALVASAVKPVSVVDKTATCAVDAEVNPDHLVAFDSSSPTVAYDDALNSKKGRAANAGFTKQKGGKSYVVLGPKTIDKDDFFLSRIMLSHEFDHVRQHTSGSKIKGNESEVDAWTTSFVRDFHRSYTIGEAKDYCYVDAYQTFSQLTGYYEKDDVGATVRKDARKRIKDYYDSTLKAHSVHDRVFRFWLYRTITGGSYKQLASDLNADLKLVNPSEDIKKVRRFDCGPVKKATFPAPPSVSLP